MKPMRLWLAGWVACGLFLAADPRNRAADSTHEAQHQADTWRAEHRLIDLHQHVGYRQDYLRRDVQIMDAVGLGIAVNLSGDIVTHKPGAPSAFEQNKALADRLCPGRFVHYMNLDYSGWDDPGFSAQAVRQVEEGHRLGAAGLKEFKRLGLYLRDKQGKLLRVDDPKLDPVWERCGQLGMPVSIHVADPRAFWLPYNPSNERWRELKDHPQWWFGDPAKFPPREELLAELNRVVGRHPHTTFVAVHFANNAEDLDWVEQTLERYPNMMADLAARIPELGRHDPAKVRRLFLKFQDRLFFATDFQVYDELTLGSGGSGPPPTDAEAETFYAKHWRWLETNDRQFAHMTPIQGDWRIDAIGLPAPALRKIYFDNAHHLLVRSLPPPTIKAVRISRDFEPEGRLTEAAWDNAPVAHLDYESDTGVVQPHLATTVRALWSDKFLYLGYRAPFTRLTVFKPAWRDKERPGLWDRDVVEAFIGSDADHPQRYAEFEVAPTGERLDLSINLPDKSLDWCSGFTSAVAVDHHAGVWTAELRIPLFTIADAKPTDGTRWRLNLYRHDVAHHAFLAWSPTATPTAHTPAKFGTLLFGE